jgi:hypothetical protein
MSLPKKTKKWFQLAISSEIIDQVQQRIDPHFVRKVFLKNISFKRGGEKIIQ